MNHDIFEGAISGLIGPILGRFASRFKYRSVFLFVVVGVYLFLFLNTGLFLGWHVACVTFFDKLLTPAGILVPPSLGLLAVVGVYISSIGVSEKN